MYDAEAAAAAAAAPQLNKKTGQTWTWAMFTKLMMVLSLFGGVLWVIFALVIDANRPLPLLSPPPSSSYSSLPSYSSSPSYSASASPSPSSSYSPSKSAQKSPGLRYALFIGGQSNSVSLNGQSESGYRYIDIEAMRAAAEEGSTQSLYLSLPETGHPGIRDGPGESEEPHPRVRIGGESVSWAFHAAKQLVMAPQNRRRINDADEIWIVGSGAGGGFSAVDFGTGVMTWDPANTEARYNFYRQMEERAERAIRQHGLIPLALLWHQGEQDAGMGMPGDVYAAHMDGMFRSFRHFLRLRNLQPATSPPLPVVVGRMGPKYRRRMDNDAYSTGPDIDAAHLGVGARVVNAAVIKTPDSTLDQHIGDGYHFPADAHREMGVDYARALLDELESVLSSAK